MQKFQNIEIENKAPTHPNIFIIRMNKPPENRITLSFAQSLISALRYVESQLDSLRLKTSQTERKGIEGGAVILSSTSPKFFCTGLDLNEPETSQNPYINTDGFYPLLCTLLDFPYPTIACITGHTFGGACPLALACDYRVMNQNRGFWSMPPVNLGLHFEGIGALPRLKLGAKVARRMLLEAERWTALQAHRDGIVDEVVDTSSASSSSVSSSKGGSSGGGSGGETEEKKTKIDPVVQMLEDRAVVSAVKHAPRAEMGVYGLLRNELWGEALNKIKAISYVHHRRVGTEAKAKI